MKEILSVEQAKERFKSGGKVWSLLKSKNRPFIWRRCKSYSDFDYPSIDIYGSGPEKGKDSYENWIGSIVLTKEDDDFITQKVKKDMEEERKNRVYEPSVQESKSCHCSPASHRDTSFRDSAVIGAVTNSAVLGAVLGGDIGGAILGDFLNGGDLKD